MIYRYWETLTDDVSEERHGDVAIVSTVVTHRKHARGLHGNCVCRPTKEKA